MRIVITGAAGFVGRALIRKLADAHDIVALDSRVTGIRNIEDIVGDIGDPVVLGRAFAQPCDAVVHLATVPGGAAEQNPAEAKRVNVDATMALIDAAAAAGNCPRFVFASSIAVFGDPLPAQVDDATLLAPRMVYGAHKAMMETWIATQSRRGAINGISLRLPGIIARPAGPSGMKSAFMSDIFHAARARRAFVALVSANSTMWLMSADRIAANITHALSCSTDKHSLALPALHIRFGDLVAEVSRATDSDPALVTYEPDPALEASFGNQPPLTTAAADALGFAHDGDMPTLVASALATIERDGA